MTTFKVTYHHAYPECDTEKLDVAYVLAGDFKEAQRKVEKYYKEEFEGAHIKKIEILEANIII